MAQELSELESTRSAVSFVSNVAGNTDQDHPAWQDFYNVHNPIIRKRISRIHTAWDVIDDLTQEVWKVVIARLPRLGPGSDLGSVTGWVVKIADNVAKRHARRRTKIAVVPLTLEIAAQLLAKDPWPGSETDETERSNESRRLLDTLGVGLSERDVRIAEMRLLEGWATTRIADALNLTQTCVMSVLHRVHLKLRDLLNRRGATPTSKQFSMKMKKKTRFLNDLGNSMTH